MRRIAQKLFLVLFLCHSVVAGAASVTCAIKEAAAESAVATSQPCHGMIDENNMSGSGSATDACTCAAACMGVALVAVPYRIEIAPDAALPSVALFSPAHSVDPVVLIRPPIA